jgi:hypothetical protein
VSSDNGVPLARLFAIAYRYLIDGRHSLLRERSWHDVRPAYGFALLAARDSGTTVIELAALMGMTKQAASKLAMSMVAFALSASPAAASGRSPPVRTSTPSWRVNGPPPPATAHSNVYVAT